MHAPVLKRAPLYPYVVLALVLVVAASIAVGVAALNYSDDDDAAATSRQAELTLLAKQQRYYDAKMTRLEEMEVAASVNVRAPTLDTTPGPHQGILEGEDASVAPAAALQSQFFDMAFGQVMVEQLLAAERLAAAGEASAPGNIDVNQYQADQMHGIAGADHAASWQRYVDLKSDQMDGTSGQ